MPKLKQATISSLKGVVVVEDFLRHKNILDNPDESEESVLSALIYLKKKKPCKEIKSSTGIEPCHMKIFSCTDFCIICNESNEGYHNIETLIKSNSVESTDASLKILENHCNEAIAKEAKSLCEYWEVNATSKSQPTVEVRYDNLTMHIRKTSLNFFLKELGGKEEDEKLADIVEKEIFHCCKRLISKGYRRTVRKITFVLRHEKNENEALKSGKISPTEFVKKHLRLS